MAGQSSLMINPAIKEAVAAQLSSPIQPAVLANRKMVSCVLFVPPSTREGEREGGRGGGREGEGEGGRERGREGGREGQPPFLMFSREMLLDGRLLGCVL